jgi:hypothetical protein
MSSGLPAISCYKMVDPVIGELTSRAEFGIVSGASNSTYVSNTANSASNSVLSFVVNVPSQQTIVDRQILISAGMSFYVQYRIANDADPCLFNYGMSESLQAFPLASIMTSLQATINNTTVSSEVNYCLPALLRLNNTRELLRYNSITPDHPDSAYFKYSDGEYASNNVLAGYTNAGLDIDVQGRGAFPVKVTQVVTSADGTVVTRANSAANKAGDVFTFNIEAIVTEPLMVSPFIWSGLHENQSMGFSGINTISLNINLDSSLRRLWSTMNLNDQYESIHAGKFGGAIGSMGTTTSSNLWSASNYGTMTSAQYPTLLLRFLSTQSSQPIPTKSIIPYMSMDSKVTQSGNNEIRGWTPAAGNTGAVMNTGTCQSSTYTLNQIPDKILVFAQKRWSDKTAKDSNAWLTIKKCNISFNNKAGLLSSATDKDLWRMSCRNGGNMNWLEWQGSASVANAQAQPSPAGSTAIFYSPGVSTPVPTTGSILVLDPALDMSLPEELASSSMGQYQFQITLEVGNQGPEDIVPELVCVFINSGMLVTEMGTSSLYSGLLDRNMVLATKDSDRSMKYTNRVVGGSLAERGLSVSRSHLLEKYPEAVAAVKSIARSKLDKFLA